MARTKQTARKSTGGVAPSRVMQTADLDFDPYDDYYEDDFDEDMVDVDAELTEEERRKKMEELRNEPMKVEVKHLEKRYNDKGNTFIVERKESEIIEHIEWWQKYALCVTHLLDRSNKFVCSRTLQVNSEFLKDTLKDVIGNYPGISFHTKTISLALRADCLYHYRPKLRQVARNLEPGSDDAAHMELLLNFIEEDFAEVISESKNLRDQGMMSFNNLWTIFPPGTLVYATVFGQPRVFKLGNYSYQYTAMGNYLQLNCAYVDYDGTQFGTNQTSFSIPEFSGAEPIAGLNAFPFRWHPEESAMENLLIARGRHFEALAGQIVRNYKGVALERGGCLITRYNISGRVMVDCATFHRLEPNSAFTVTEFPSSSIARSKRSRLLLQRNQSQADLISDDAKALEPLTERQCLLSNALVRGFSFTEKKFLDFFVDNLTEPEWNDRCFDQLVLPQTQKDTVQALVSTHAQQSVDFDDIVKNKGRGLVLVLHGPPGVGKTLTAECVAEYTHRPLYSVSSGDLGTTSTLLDERLTRILDMASTWKAVLLIDEADIFLERRCLSDLQRNSMVSIFLRVLEYYSGVLFLTTNRVTTFDDAFKSRIHVPLKYGALPQSSRARIWRNFLGDMHVDGKADRLGSTIRDEDIEELSQGLLNGRQIKNVVRTAKSLAIHRKVPLDLWQLSQVMKIQLEFEKDLDNTGVEEV